MFVAYLCTEPDKAGSLVLFLKSLCFLTIGWKLCFKRLSLLWCILRLGHAFQLTAAFLFNFFSHKWSSFPH